MKILVEQNSNKVKYAVTDDDNITVFKSLSIIEKGDEEIIVGDLNQSNATAYTIADEQDELEENHPYNIPGDKYAFNGVAFIKI